MKRQMVMILDADNEIRDSKSYTNIRFWEADQNSADEELNDITGWPTWQVNYLQY